eukprot:TRINITY_DN61307_c0_g1_i1.p1 TRINITY_DN61307_c0_g1~~TRINITY_DN61307_c0_g1_i1.p1  ORF type:complete len:919 (+),score=248.58 TRINITY_DN61307_c0_g1_i1:85-2757(+)
MRLGGCDADRQPPGRSPHSSPGSSPARALSDTAAAEARVAPLPAPRPPQPQQRQAARPREGGGAPRGAQRPLTQRPASPLPGAADGAGRVSPQLPPRPASAAAGRRPSGPGPTPEPPPLDVPCSEWSVEETARRVTALSADWADERFVSLLRQHEVDGAALAELTKADLRDDFGIRELGRIKRALRAIARLCGAETAPTEPSELSRMVTPEPGAFDVPISAEDLVGGRSGARTAPAAERKDAQREQQAPGAAAGADQAGAPDAASPPPPAAVSTGASSPDTGVDSSGRAAASPPPRPASCPPDPNARPGEADWGGDDEADIDAIDLADLVPDRGRSLAKRSSLPPRPVTAIGHRPTVAPDSDEEGSPHLAVLPGNHRHVWEDDPAVVIRHPADPERDLGERMTPPPGHLLGRAEEPVPRVAWAQPTGRPKPIPRPPAELGPGDLPNGKRLPDWVCRHWQPQQREEVKPAMQLIAASSGAPVYIEGEPYPCGILERERRYQDLRELFDLWDASGDGGGTIDLAEIRTVLQDFCRWTDAEAELRTRQIMAEIDEDSDGQLDWPEFHAFMSKSSRTAGPAEFDGLVRHFRAAVRRVGERIERARRADCLERLFRRWDADGSGFVELRELAAVLAQLNEASGEGAAVPVLSAADADADGTVDCAEFQALMGSITDALADSQFDLVLYRVGRAVDEAHNEQLFRKGLPHGKRRSGAVVTADTLDRLARLASPTAPLLMLGCTADPSKALERCAELRGAALHPFLVTTEKSERVAQRAIARQGFSKGHWVYVVLGSGYEHADRFLREAGLRLHTEPPWALHAAFRLWVFMPGCAEGDVPSVFLLRSIVLPLDAFDPDSTFRRLEADASGGPAPPPPPPGRGSCGGRRRSSRAEAFS